MVIIAEINAPFNPYARIRNQFKTKLTANAIIKNVTRSLLALKMVRDGHEITSRTYPL